MPAFIRSKLSFANLASALALFIALGGGAYAAATVNSATIVNNSVKSKDLRNNNVRGIDVREKSLAPVCPANAPNQTDGVCFGAQHAGVGSAGDWDVAARQCASENLRLPSLGELLSVTDAVNTGDTYLWTDAFGTEAATRILVRTNDAGFSRIASGPKAGPRPYRCVTNAR